MINRKFFLLLSPNLFIKFRELEQYIKDNKNKYDK